MRFAGTVVAAGLLIQSACELGFPAYSVPAGSASAVSPSHWRQAIASPTCSVRC
jgi:hypothetical protein